MKLESCGRVGQHEIHGRVKTIAVERIRPDCNQQTWLDCNQDDCNGNSSGRHAAGPFLEQDTKPFLAVVQMVAGWGFSHDTQN